MRMKFFALALVLAPVAVSAQSLDLGSAPTPPFTVGGGDVTAPGIGGGGGSGITPVALSVTPEPSTYVLLASGLLGVFGIARRRAQK